MGKHDTTGSRVKTRRGDTQRLQLVLAVTVCLFVCSLLMNVLIYVHLTAAITDQTATIVDLSRRLEDVEGRQDSHRSTGDIHPMSGNNPDVKTATGQNDETSRDTDNYQSPVDVPGWSNQSALRRRRGINLHTLSEVYRAYEEKERRSRMYTSLGCWRDRYPDRAIPTLERTDPRLDRHYISRQNPIEKCYQVALSRGFTVFAVQHDGECFGSADARSTYKKYGPSTACATDGEGGRRANEVYQIKGQTVNKTDHCKVHRCQNNATCHNKDDGYTCICTEGWSGEYCQHKIDHCEGHKCQNNATCNNNKKDGYTCICSKGWSGEYCQNDRCEGHLCQNNATCRPNEDGYTCICPSSWRGKHCEKKRALSGQQRRKRYGLGSLLSVHIQAKTDTSETGGTILVTGNFTQWRDMIAEAGFALQNGQLKIKEAGRYFIYSQVYFGKEQMHDHNAVARYSIKKGRELQLTCERPLTGVPPPLTCYTAGVLDLKRDDTLVIYVHTNGSPATIDTAEDATFWGAIKLSMDIPIVKGSRQRNRKGKT